MPSYIRGISSNNIQKVALHDFADSFYLASDFVLRLTGLKADYRSIPFSIWRPCIPAIERHIPPVGAAAWLYRLLRVTWVVITLPSWIGLVLLAEILRLPNDTLPPSILPRRPTWTLWQRLTYPLLARAVW